MTDSGPRPLSAEANRPEAGLSATAPQAIDVDIEELVLHGFAPQGRFSIAEAIRRELTELLNEGGFPSAWLGGECMANLDGGTFDVVPGFRAETIGRQVARVVYQRWLAADER